MNLSEINSLNTWHIGTGDATRNYFKYFLSFGVAFVAPGHPGREGDESTKRYYEENPKVNNWGKTLSEVRENDWVIARKGRKMILAIGIVKKTYDYSDLFNDAGGWSSNHFIIVDWYIPKNSHQIIKFEKDILPMNTMGRCKQQEVYDSIKKTTFEKQAPIHNLSTSLTKLSKQLVLDQLVGEFINYGLRIQDAENVVTTLKRVKRLAIWYFENDYSVSEDEIRAFLVLPFFTALGWSEQKIKLEYKKIDVALFTKPFVKADQELKTSPEIIVEVKTYHNGLAFTKEQAKRYGKMFKETTKFITTNGYRYFYYEKEGDELIEKGYFNVRKLKEKNDLMPFKDYLSTIDTIVNISNFR